MPKLPCVFCSLLSWKDSGDEANQVIAVCVFTENKTASGLQQLSAMLKSLANALRSVENLVK